MNEEVKSVEKLDDSKEIMRKTRERKRWEIPKEGFLPLASITNKESGVKNSTKPLPANKEPLKDNTTNANAPEELLDNSVNVQIIPPSEIAPIEHSSDIERDDLDNDSVESTLSRADNQDHAQHVPIAGFARVDFTTTLEQNISVDTTDIKVIKKLTKEGQVYLARSIPTNSLIALKQFIVKADMNDAKETIEGLANVVEMVKSLEHSNIIKYLGFHRPNFNSGETMLRYNIIMEYMEKGSLHEMLKYQNKGLAKSLIQTILRQVLIALEYLHSHHILHRNIKSSNILVDKKITTFKITDFELSTKVDNANPYVQRECAGTPWYMAPEVILGEPYSYTADIWSLGCLAFELFTGKKPFDDSDGMKAMNQMVNYQSPLKMCSNEVKSVLQYRENATLLDFLNSCWKKDPTVRPSANTLLKHPFLKKPAVRARGNVQSRPATGVTQSTTSSRFKATNAKAEARGVSSNKKTIKTPKPVHK